MLTCKSKAADVKAAKAIVRSVERWAGTKDFERAAERACYFAPSLFTPVECKAVSMIWELHLMLEHDEPFDSAVVELASLAAERILRLPRPDHRQ